jgi:uncharacterized protein
MELALPGVDLALRSLGPEARWDVADRSLGIVATPRSDWFFNPWDGTRRLEAVALVGRPVGDFALRAKVTVGFRATFDAGVLVVRASDDDWAKLCFERAPDGQPMVVSVVTRGVSDDANAFDVEARTVWLRVIRIGAGLAFHGSLDGRHWRFVRQFTIPAAETAEVGFLAQSPTGDGCHVSFEAIDLSGTVPRDLRDGT